MCEQKQSIFAPMDIHTVFVSPLKRAIQTAYYTFKDHLNFENIKFVILPKMRELMNYSSGVPSNIEVTVERFREGIPQLDDTLLDKYPDRLHYFLEDTDESLRDEIYAHKAWKEDDCIKSNVFDLLIAKSLEIKPKKLESNLSIYNRANSVKAFVNDYVRNLPDPNSKVVLVSHYFFLRFWTAQWEGEIYEDDRSEIKRPDAYAHFHNCDVYYTSTEEA